MAKKEIKAEENTVKVIADPKDTTERLLLCFCMGSQALGRIADYEIAELRKGFDYEDSCGVEKALIDHIVLCWMRHRKWEFNRATFDIEGSHSFESIAFVERQLHLAHTRYLGAIEELVKVRFLMSRTNMARLQVVREGMKRKDQPQQEPGKVLEMKAG